MLVLVLYVTNLHCLILTYAAFQHFEMHTRNHLTIDEEWGGQLFVFFAYLVHGTSTNAGLFQDGPV